MAALVVYQKVTSRLKRRHFKPLAHGLAAVTGAKDLSLYFEP
jgi:hypothetical protein